MADLAKEFHVEQEAALAHWVRETHFSHHSPKTARLNHGSFGAIPKQVLELSEQVRREWYSQPDKLYFTQLAHGFRPSREALSQVINAPVEHTVLLTNATYGAVVVAEHVARERHEGHARHRDSEASYVLLFNVCYNAYNMLFQHYCRRAGYKLLYVPLPFPFHDQQQLLDAYRSTLESVPRGRIRLAVLDHITSNPSYALPIKTMIEMAHEFEVEEVFIDGAHAIGAVPIDVVELGCDYYVANVHKWMFGATGCAVFYCKNEDKIKGTKGLADPDAHDNQLHHPIISHDYRNGLVAECYWHGTCEYTSWFVVPESVAFYREIGAELRERLPYESDAEAFAAMTGEPLIVARYNRRKALWALTMLAEAWGTDIGTPLENVTSLGMVRLPPTLTLRNADDALRFRHLVRQRYDIECIPFYNDQDGTSYIRIAAQIYNSPNDFYRLRDAVLASIASQHHDSAGQVQW